MGTINIKECGIEGLFTVEPEIHSDSRGFFVETYNRRDYVAAGLDAEFVQTNLSYSSAGVLRGLHFQTRKPQAKLVSVVSGAAFDVAVDIRPGSTTFGKWYGALLTMENLRCLYIPEGLAHGFYAMKDGTVVQYMVSDYYDPGGEGGIAYDDPGLSIDWPIPLGMPPMLSERDRQWPNLVEWIEQCE